MRHCLALVTCRAFPQTETHKCYHKYMRTKWKIKYYYTTQGVAPVYRFIESLAEKAQSKVYRSFDMLQEYGVELRQPHVKKITGTALWELRILGADSIRVFYVAEIEQTFLMLHGFIKKSQKTPKKEIKVAINRLNDFQGRK